MLSLRRWALAVAIITVAAAPAYAASNHTAVSGLGNDANPCTIAQPCRTLQGAFQATAPGGEIEVLEPAGYGTLTITHAISIQGHGWASMNAAPGNDIITINAGPNDAITLRGLVIEGFGVAANGIVFRSGGALVIEDSVIQNTSSDGLVLVPAASMILSVSNTRFTGNTGAGVDVDTQGQSGLFVRGSFEHVIVENGGTGDSVQFIAGPNTVNFALRDCTLTNGFNGLLASGAFANIMVQNSTIAANTRGVVTADGGTIRITRTAITGNQDSIITFSPPANTGVLSYGDNTIDGNSNNEPPTAKIPVQ